MRNVVRTFIKYPILGNAILFGILLFGIITFSTTQTTFFPDVESSTIYITASYPGASPEEIEEGIVLKIEDNLKGVTGVDRVTSTSSENSATIEIELKSGYDINDVLQDIKNAVDQISTFPVDMEELNVYKQEMLSFGVSFVISGDVDLRELKEAARDIERDLLSFHEISKVELSGFPDEEIEVAVRESDMRKFGLTFDQVSTAISNANVKLTGGTIKGTTEEFLVRADTKGYYAEDLANHVVMTTSDGTIVRVKDVATLTDKWEENPNRLYYNGKSAVQISVNNTNEEDLFVSSNYVMKYIDKFNASHNKITANVLRDGSKIIAERANILMKNGLLGFILVLLFLSLSLNTRLAFWVALAIPVSFAGMFMVSPFYGFTFNVMSLMAMILVIGILVDDGIVIAENIYQQYEKGKKPIEAAVNGTLQVLPAVSSAIFTTVVIFLTFFFLEGRMGDRTKDIAFVVSATLTFSLVEGMFILPAHIAHSKALRTKQSDKSKLEIYSTQVLQWIKQKLYLPALKFCINHPLVALTIPVALFMITLGAVNGSIIKTTFFPAMEADYVGINLEMPAGTPDAVTDSILAELEKAIVSVNQDYQDMHEGDTLVTDITRTVGPNTHEGSISAPLVEARYREWSNSEVANRIRGYIGEVKDAELLEVDDGGGFFGKPVSIVLKSDDLEKLNEAKDALKLELSKVSDLTDVIDDNPPGLREVKVKLKDKAFALGLTASTVLNQVRSGFFGNQAQRILRGVDEVNIYVRYDKADRSSIDDLRNMRIRTSDDREFPLGEIASFEIEQGIMSINHIDAQRVISVEANIADPRESVTDILADIEADIMPGIIAQFPEVDFAFEGQSRESAKTTSAIMMVVPAVLVLMFLIIVITFRSFIQAFIVLLLIPFSLIGVAWGHFFQGYFVSMLSLFGTIALGGIVVNDSLVFVNAFNRFMKKGMKFKDALIETGDSRFRPVLLTSLTTIAGLGPLIFETSHHAHFLSPMAISVAYGLFFGTLLTLLMLPSLLVVVNRLKILLARIFTGKEYTPESVESAVREEIFIREQQEEAR